MMKQIFRVKTQLNEQKFQIETQNLQLGSLNQVAAFLVNRQLLNPGRNITTPIHLDREKATPSKIHTNLINSDRKETKPAITKANNTSPLKPNTTEVKPNKIPNHSGRTRDATKLTNRYDRNWVEPKEH